MAIDPVPAVAAGAPVPPVPIGLGLLLIGSEPAPAIPIGRLFICPGVAPGLLVSAEHPASTKTSAAGSDHFISSSRKPMPRIEDPPSSPMCDFCTSLARNFHFQVPPISL